MPRWIVVRLKARQRIELWTGPWSVDCRPGINDAAVCVFDVIDRKVEAHRRLVGVCINAPDLLQGEGRHVVDKHLQSGHIGVSDWFDSPTKKPRPEGCGRIDVVAVQNDCVKLYLHIRQHAPGPVSDPHARRRVDVGGAAVHSH